MNKLLLYICFFTGIFLGSFFYTFGSYYFRYAEANNIKFTYIFIVSLFLGMISYSIKIPIFYYFGKELNVFFINTVFLVTVFISVILYSKFVLNEKIEIHTYIICTLILLLLITNNILSNKKV
jgi:hypothetical protein